MEPSLIHIGWREWLALPELGIARIKAKIDTGARTSCLHTFFIEPFSSAGQDMVRFGVHPLRKRTTPEVICTAPVTDLRTISDSGGHREQRYIITTVIGLGSQRREIEISLTNRESMRFRMLLGRTAMNGLLIEPARSYLCGRPGKVITPKERRNENYHPVT